jgi:serine/threonine-protein kinase HipA
MTACKICLEKVDGSDQYHPSCIETLFETPTLPTLDLELSNLYATAAEMAGKMSISGVQKKVSLRLADDKKSLILAPSGGRYILKPESQYDQLPQNEHATMCLAKLASIDVPPLGLIDLSDGSTCYIIKRFDRLDGGTKLSVEDFCQLSEKPTKDKYRGSAELCTRLVNKFATEPLIEIRKLYRMLLFNWVVANGDMHLKNFSLLTDQSGNRVLSPGYDFVCTKLVLPKDTVALTIHGKRAGITRNDWLEFAKLSQLPPKVAERIIEEQIDVLDSFTDLIDLSYLSETMKNEFTDIVTHNIQILRG